MKNSAQKPICHCHLYVSFKGKLDASCDVRKNLQSMIGCPVIQAYPLRVGEQYAYKVKIDRNHLWHALSSQGGNRYRVRLRKSSANHLTYPTSASTHVHAPLPIKDQKNVNIASWNCRGYHVMNEYIILNIFRRAHLSIHGQFGPT